MGLNLDRDGTEFAVVVVVFVAKFFVETTDEDGATWEKQVLNF